MDTPETMNERAISRLQREIMQERIKRTKAEEQLWKIQSKAATQLNEIARLTQRLEALTSQKMRLLANEKLTR